MLSRPRHDVVQWFDKLAVNKKSSKRNWALAFFVVHRGAKPTSYTSTWSTASILLFLYICFYCVWICFQSTQKLIPKMSLQLLMVVVLFAGISLEAVKKINKIIHFILILLLVKHITGTHPMGHDANEQKHDDMDSFCCTKAWKPGVSLMMLHRSEVALQPAQQYITTWEMCFSLRGGQTNREAAPGISLVV